MYPQYKIKEARHFLSQAKQFIPASEEFCFTFSALLSAIRSVTFAMQKLYKHQDGFNAEYNKLLDDIYLIPFAGELVKARNISEKEGHKVPVLITTLVENDTNNMLVFECDPLPSAEMDVIRKIRFEYGNDKEGWVPADLSEEKQQEMYLGQFAYVLMRMKQSGNFKTKYSIKLTSEGAETTMNELYEAIDRLLSILEKAEYYFESLWPSKSMFSDLVKLLNIKDNNRN